MSQVCECRISLEEIAEKAGYLALTAVVNHADRLGLDVADDWSGRPSVSVLDAARLYAAVTGSAEENSRANHERIRAEDDATVAREAAERKIFNDVYDEGVRKGVSGPRAYERAVEAVSQAREAGQTRTGALAKFAKKMVGV